MRTTAHVKTPWRSCCTIGALLVLASALLVAGCGTSGVQSTTGTARSTGAGAGAGVSSVGPASPVVYRVPSGSMEPTLPVGASVEVRRGVPEVGAIVTYHPPEGFETQQCGPRPHVIKPGAAACDASIPSEAKIELVRRIVAGPGDEIYIRGGHVYRKAPGSPKFVQEREPYVRPCGSAPECEFPTPIEIPTGSWFLMGDNRQESNDSRFWGPIPNAWVAGVVSAAGEQPKLERAKPRQGGLGKAGDDARRPTALRADTREHLYARLIACLRRGGVRVSSSGAIGAAHDASQRIVARRCRAQTLGELR
jgi:signal peptidase I